MNNQWATSSCTGLVKFVHNGCHGNNIFSAIIGRCIQVSHFAQGKDQTSCYHKEVATSSQWVTIRQVPLNCLEGDRKDHTLNVQPIAGDWVLHEYYKWSESHNNTFTCKQTKINLSKRIEPFHVTSSRLRIHKGKQTTGTILAYKKW